MLIGLIGMGVTLLYCLTDPLERACDKLLQLADPEHEPYRGESADDESEHTAVIPAVRAREFTANCGHSKLPNGRGPFHYLSPLHRSIVTSALSILLLTVMVIPLVSPAFQNCGISRKATGQMRQTNLFGGE